MPGIEGLRSKLTYANVMSTVAAFLALAGGTTAIALSGKNSVKKGDIAANAVRAREIVKGAVLTGEVKNETLLASDLAAGSVGAAEILTGTIGTGEILDGTIGTADQADVPVARIERTAVMSVTNNVVEVVDFDTENSPPNSFDPNGMFDLADPDHVTVPIDGLYLIGSRVVWSPDSDLGHRELRTAATTTPGMVQPPEVRDSARANDRIVQEANGILDLEAGDDITVALVQDNVDMSSLDASRVTLEVVWLAPGV
jgi:hypothetical protein